LLDYLAAGDPLERFLDHFPSLRREQTVAVLQLAADLLKDPCASCSMSHCRDPLVDWSLVTRFEPLAGLAEPPSRTACCSACDG
jgi:hypothetical protein